MIKFLYALSVFGSAIFGAFSLKFLYNHYYYNIDSHPQVLKAVVLLLLCLIVMFYTSAKVKK